MARKSNFFSYDQKQKKVFLFPFFLSLLFIIISFLPFEWVYLKKAFVFLPLIPLYIWGVYHLLYNRFLMAILIGGLMDFTGGGCFGIWTISYFIACFGIGWFSNLNRKMQWLEYFLGFCFVLTVCALIAILASVLAYEHTRYFLPVFESMLLSIILYPILYQGFLFYRKKIDQDLG